MFDNITCALPTTTHQDFGVVDILKINGNEFIPCPYFDIKTRRTKAKYYRYEHGNLILTLYPGEIKLKNSLHKFLHGNNFSDFTISDFVEAVDIISDCTSFDWWQSKVSKLEYGVNIQMDSSFDYRRMNSYKTKDYIDMEWRGTIYGAKCIFDEYNIKLYNKTLEVLMHTGEIINTNLYRWEVGVTKLRSLTGRTNSPVPIRSLRDIIDPNITQLLYSDLIAKFQKSTFDHDYSFLERQKPNVIRSCAVVFNKHVASIMKGHHPRSFVRDLLNANLALHSKEDIQYSEFKRRLLEKATFILS